LRTMSDQSPEAVSAEFAAAIEARDIPAAIDLWLDDALMIQADGHTIQGRNAIEAALRALIDNDIAVDIDLARTFVTGDVAIGLGTLTMRGASDGGQPFAQRSRSVVIYAKRPDGCWRLAIDAPWGLPQP
jgi:uncharacterized protein (TIGR02246 family)